MLLLPVAELRADLGFDDMADFNAAAQAALSVATSSIAAMLDTSFEYGEVIDLFYLERPGIVRAGSVATELRLSNGFVKNIISAGYASDLNDPLATILGTTLVKKEKGILLDHYTIYAHQYVQVIYTKGFRLDPNMPDSYLREDIPQWLLDATSLQSKINLGSSPSFQQAGITQDTGALQRQLRDILIPHLRYNPSASRPL